MTSWLFLLVTWDFLLEWGSLDRAQRWSRTRCCTVRSEESSCASVDSAQVSLKSQSAQVWVPKQLDLFLSTNPSHSWQLPPRHDLVFCLYFRWGHRAPCPRPPSEMLESGLQLRPSSIQDWVPGLPMVIFYKYIRLSPACCPQHLAINPLSMI